MPRNTRGGVKRHGLAALAVAGLLAGAVAGCGSGGGAGSTGTAADAQLPAGPTASSWNLTASDRALLSSPKLNDVTTTSTCHAHSTTLSFWSSVQDINRAVNYYNLTHPSVCVKLDVSSGPSEYSQLEIALKANSGAPDVVKVAQTDVTDLALSGALLNMAKYGAAAARKDFVPWSWKIVSPSSSEVWGIPQDSGPLGLMYNTRIFQKYHLAVPTTWAQFAAESRQLHAEAPGIYLTDYPTLPAEEIIWWQTGAYPVHWTYGSTTLAENYDLPGAVTAAKYWDGLYKQGVLGSVSVNASFSAMAKGQIASQFAPAWLANLFTTEGSTAGDWKVAPLPQWSAGKNVDVDEGGSVTAVTKVTSHPQQATAFSIWLGTAAPAQYLLANAPISLFPTDEGVLGNKQFLSGTIALTGSQKIWSTYSGLSNDIDQSWEWSPIEPYVETAFGDDFDQVLVGKLTMTALLPELNRQVAAEAKGDGFHVTRLGSS
jgi:multiple sugar transport system substrate-binding protein